MGLDKLLDIVYTPTLENWSERNRSAFDALFGSTGGRYDMRARTSSNVRAPAIEGGVSYAAYLHPSNPASGRYQGLSFVVFPATAAPALFGLVVGTDGLSPDEAVLGRPGHARKAHAITAWLNASAKDKRIVAWSKEDPTRTDLNIPQTVVHMWPEHNAALTKYGKEVYALYRPDDNREATLKALAAFLDLLFEERGFRTLVASKANSDEIRANWFKCIMPTVEISDVADLLARRRYAILQGPPGTGKTKMALDLLRNTYQGNGTSIQFHPNTTYENFVGGLAPYESGAELGLRFAPKRGFLMEAAEKALADSSKPYLLHIDEINRADLGKVLGEAMFLLELDAEHRRNITLPYDFGPPFGNTFSLPDNLHVLGTMNSADRSIAIVDVAVRRRFAFRSLWPRADVVEGLACRTMQDAFQALLSILVEHANADTFALVPGHSYFLEKDERNARMKMQVELVPLLEEYLAQGYVAGFSEQIRAFIQNLGVR